MSLQVWLPLTKDFRNYGLDNVIVTNNGATYESTGGKLGGCYKTSAATIDLQYNGNQVNTGSISFGGWFKFNKSEMQTRLDTYTYTDVRYTVTGNLIGNNSYGGVGLIWYSNNMYNSSGTLNNLYICCALRSTTNGAKSTNGMEIPFDTWVHLLLVFDKTTKALQLWIDGVLRATTTMLDFDDARDLNLMLNYNAVWGGNGPAFAIPFSVNDVRIYDHALSLREIKRVIRVNRPGLQVWLPLNKDPNMTPAIASYRIESGVTLTADTDGWYKVQDTTHASGGRWGIYYDFNVRPNTTYTLYVYSKSTTGVSARVGIQSFATTVGWSGIVDTNTGAEKFTTYTWTTGANHNVARIYLALTTTATKANDYVFYKEPRIYEAPQNQGLSNVSVTDKGPTYNSNGKLGGCYYFDGNGNRMNINHSVAGLTSFTVCLWVKSPTNSLKGCAFCYIQNSGGMWKFATYNNNLCVRDNSRTSYDAGSRYQYSLGTFVADQWTHIACSYNAGEVKIYRDGTLLSTNHTEGTYMDNYVGTCGISDPVNTGTTGYWFNGSINDFRTYDYALSDQEIKEISRGLVVHYPLNNNGLGGENLLKDTKAEKTHVYNSSSLIYYYFDFSGNLPTGTYTFSFDIKSSNGTDGCYVSYANGSSTINRIGELRNIPTVWTHYVYTFTHSSTACNDIFFAHYYGHGGSSTPNTNNTGTIYVKNIKLEKGSIVTQWSPATSELADASIIRDISGYQNNGTVTGALSVAGDTVRYKVATYFDGSSYISREPLHSEVKSFSFWLKCANASTTQQIVFVDFGTKLAFGFYNGYIITSYTATAITGNKVLIGDSWLNDDWNHIAVVKDNNAILTYCNGTLMTASGSDYWSYNTDEYFMIGRRPHGDRQLLGHLSDFRAYATALSASDIAELYEMGREVM